MLILGIKLKQITNMNKKITAALLASTALLGSVNVAHSQLTMAGYTELAYISGGYKIADGVVRTSQINGGSAAAQTSNNDIGKQIGSEVSLRFTNRHNLAGPLAGYYAQAMAELRRTAAVWEDKGVTFGPTNNSFILFMEQNVVRGNEVTRNLVPFVGQASSGVIGGGPGLVDILDSSSGVGNYGVHFPDVAGGALSLSYAPNMASGVNSSTNNSSTIANKGDRVTESQSRGSIGYRNSNIKLGLPGTLDVGLGYMKGSINRANGQDPKSVNYGLGYRQGPLAVGIQRFKNDNPTAVAGGNNDTVLNYGLTFAATPQITLGASLTRQEGTQNAVKDPDDITAKHFSASYNMGPAVVVLDYMLISNANYVVGQDMAPIKARFRVNF